MIKENHHSPGYSGHSTSSLHETLNLPKYVTLGTENFVLDLIKDEKVSEMYSMISEAMQNGEGYGIDEYKSEGEFLAEVNGGPIFAVMDVESNKMVAAFALAHSKYYRSTEARVVDPVIIVHKSHRGQGLGSYIFEKCIEFAKELNYSSMYVDTFTNNIPMIKIITKRQFVKVGTLPLGGRMPDGSIVGMNLYYMQFLSDIANTQGNSVSSGGSQLSK